MAKSIFKRLILMVSVLGVMLFSMPNTSSAEDVWCYSSYGFSYYLSSDTIRQVNLSGGISYTVSGKLVHDSSGTLQGPLSYGFSIPNDNLEGYTFDRTNGHWVSASKDEALAVWNAMKPYMRQKGIYFGESWK
ncbi:MAG: hypothetical protein SOZ01_01460 [Selenomonadaceae bacterium]|nr:hypothetical protein [Selenomonadaceae bacterium]MDD6119074.1 hypothetical protein [Selenomonadaceae bacterium]MDD7055625.1 hypothetical protein [Selenomonadaceae bacterium]MDY3915401.1 hypothetical protein [Selenomonadaceae bacterium]